MDKTKLTTWLEIDLGAIRNNIRQIREISHTKVMAVVKGNAYGHGLVPVARAVTEAGADWCGVARIEEALTLREAGFEGKILVLGYIRPGRIVEAYENDISAAVYDPQVAQAFSEEMKRVGGVLKVHVKIDSGMGRLGVFAENGHEFVREVFSLPGIQLEGIFTHFARADEPDLYETVTQIERFDAMLTRIEKMGISIPLVHASNSAGLLYFPNGRFNMVRGGIIVYGLHPSDEAPAPSQFKPALTLKARLASVKMIPAGQGIGYNYRYTTKGVERIGSVAVGYADGIRRSPVGDILIHGKRAKILGTACMDQILVQLDHVPEAQIGDEVVVIGAQGDERIPAEELARRWQTSNYEVVCGMANRVPRIYID